MNKLYARLFGKFTVAAQPHTPMILEGAKVQELFSYLLLYRNRPHTREVLATMLWCDASATQCKSYLRKTLWQLQSELEQVLDGCLSDFLHVDGEWVQLNTGDRLWLDVAQFEQTFAQIKESPGQTWDDATAKQVATAIDLYRSDLLEGAYQEWCLFERERLQRLYLIMLEKLMNYCEADGHYETGIGYGMQVLRYDLARENSHRSLMRLHYLAGNRSEALRQYERCAKILREELAVEPGRRTKALYEQMVAEELPQGQGPEGQRGEETAVFSPECSLRQTLQQLETLRSLLSETQHQIQQNIALVEATLHKIPPQTPQDRSEIRLNNAVGYGRLLAYAPESSINS
ncbi:MAG: bacterial transcriptional activator domain-containing protein [Chloroflexota bacterium]|jgi:DNA-binding SARP family transcriptional activator